MLSATDSPTPKRSIDSFNEPPTPGDTTRTQQHASHEMRSYGLAARYVGVDQLQFRVKKPDGSLEWRFLNREEREYLTRIAGPVRKLEAARAHAQQLEAELQERTRGPFLKRVLRDLARSPLGIPLSGLMLLGAAVLQAPLWAGVGVAWAAFTTLGERNVRRNLAARLAVSQEEVTRLDDELKELNQAGAPPSLR